MKVSITLVRDPAQLTRYATFCGLALARAHAGSAAAIAGYLGTSDKVDKVLLSLASGSPYADQTERTTAS
jgi:hypothetical protein